MWRTDLLIDAAETALRDREAELCREHAVYGLDSLSETGIHPLLERGFAAAGLGVLREQPYPQEWRRKRGRRTRADADHDLPMDPDRLRCDLVLTPHAGQRLQDALAAERSARRERAAIRGTLFEGVAVESPGDQELPDGDVAASEAYWLEVKLVAQHCYTHGVPGPNTTYAGELRRATRDLVKLHEDGDIVHAGLLLVVFTADGDVARHDVSQLVHACLDRGMPIASPVIRTFGIRERIGNSAVTLCLVDLRKISALSPLSLGD